VRRGLILTAVLAGVLLGGAAARAADYQGDVQQLLRGATEAETPCGVQPDKMKAALTDKGFDKLSRAQRAQLLAIGLVCNYVKDEAQMLDYAQTLDRIGDQPIQIGMANLMLFNQGLTVEKFEGERLIKALANWPEGLDDTSLVDATLYLGMAKDGDHKLYLRVLNAMIKAPWSASDIKQAAANDWSLAYAVGLADQKDMDGVRAAIAQMTDPDSLAQIAEDRRFEPLWAEMQAKGRFDWKALTETNLAAYRVAVAVSLDRAGPADILIEALIHDEQLPSALTIGERWRKKVEAGQQIPDADSADWVLDHYGDALVASGRVDEAAAVYKMANDMDLDPVSHRLNWAQHLLALGRFGEALPAFAEVDATKTSPAGQLWIKEGQACANAKDHPDVAAKIAGDIRIRAKENPQALEATLLCLNQVDEAADLYAKRFADPDQRADALAAARKGPAPKDASPFETELNARKQAALAMPKAAKALDAVGRRLDAPVQLTSFRNF
jgi:hypothetical protein